MIIAMPVWNGRISPVFDSAQKLLITEYSDKQLVRQIEESFIEKIPQKRVQELVDLQVQVLICGAISQCLWQMMVAAGIQVIPFIKGNTDIVLNAFTDGKLLRPSFLMPGCCGRKHRFRGKNNF